MFHSANRKAISFFHLISLIQTAFVRFYGLNFRASCSNGLCWVFIQHFRSDHNHKIYIFVLCFSLCVIPTKSKGNFTKTNPNLNVIWTFGLRNGETIYFPNEMECNFEFRDENYDETKIDCVLSNTFVGEEKKKDEICICILYLNFHDYSECNFYWNSKDVLIPIPFLFSHTLDRLFLSLLFLWCSRLETITHCWIIQKYFPAPIK